MTTEFKESALRVAEWLKGRPVEPGLAAELNARFPVDGREFRELAEACKAGVLDGKLAIHQSGPVKFERVIEPSDDSHRFSVDVVVAPVFSGRRHSHPTGEIDMIIPLHPDARFDDHGEGWLVYPPESEHTPTTTGGDAIIIYFLPEGQIDWEDERVANLASEVG